MNAANYKPLIFYVGFHLVQYCIHFHFHDCGRFLLIFCIILLRNHKRTELGKLHTYLESVRSLENCQRYGEPCFAGVIKDVCCDNHMWNTQIHVVSMLVHIVKIVFKKY
jgi:hypothetical protein